MSWSLERALYEYDVKSAAFWDIVKKYKIPDSELKEVFERAKRVIAQRNGYLEDRV